jgi:hypothetical protein
VSCSLVEVILITEVVGTPETSVYLSEINNSVLPEPEGSSPYWQEPTTCPYPESTESTPHPGANLPKIHYDSILPSMTRSSEWFLSFGVSHQTVYTFLSSPMHSTCPAHLILLDFICLMIFGDKYINETTRCYIPGDRHLDTRRRENQESHRTYEHNTCSATDDEDCRPPFTKQATSKCASWSYCPLQAHTRQAICARLQAATSDSTLQTCQHEHKFILPPLFLFLFLNAYYILFNVTHLCLLFYSFSFWGLLNFSVLGDCLVCLGQPWARRRSRFTSGPRINFGWTASPSSKRMIYIVLKTPK